jgi:periplasmic divalent cation tolerance protein
MRRPVSGEHQTVVEVKTRVPDRETAEKIAEVVVAERLAAFAHVRGPIDSWYWWHGSVETAQEWEVDVVTTAALRDRCTARIRELHPYQLPALLVLDLTASAEYTSWVQANTC